MRSNRPSLCDAESRHLLRRLLVLASERLRSVRSPCPQYVQQKAIRRQCSPVPIGKSRALLFGGIRHRLRKRDRLLTCDRNGDYLLPFHFAYFQVLRLSPSDLRG